MLYAVPGTEFWPPELIPLGLLLVQVAGDRYDANQMKRGWRSGVTASSA